MKQIKQTNLVRGYASFNNGGQSITLAEVERTNKHVPETRISHELILSTFNIGISTESSILVQPGLANALRAIADKIDSLDIRVPKYLDGRGFRLSEVPDVGQADSAAPDKSVESESE